MVACLHEWGIGSAMIEQDIVGHIEGREIRAFRLVNRNGLAARVMELGASLIEFQAPDRAGQLADVALGQDGLESYLASHSYFGALCGRYANRIAEASFLLDGKRHQVSRNEGRNHLHGGLKGFDKRIWTATPEAGAVVFAYRSADGEEGFPGTLELRARFSLSAEDRFVIEIEAETDAPTLCNIAHHGYWNLAGHGAGEVLDHELQIDADLYTPTDSALIPTGEILRVAGTPVDFRAGKPIGRDIGAITTSVGYDHNFVLRGFPGEMKRAARLFHPASGRGFELHTSEPGLQIYTGGHFGGAILGKGKIAYRRFAGLALETQRFPDSPNQGHFPSARLDPGATYRHRMEFRFFRD
jgi:aldose 1-epimerase